MESDLRPASTPPHPWQATAVLERPVSAAAPAIAATTPHAAEPETLAASTDSAPVRAPAPTIEVQAALQRLWTTAQPEGSGPHHRRVAPAGRRGQRKSMMPDAFDLMIFGSVAFVIACALTVLAAIVVLEHVLPVSTSTGDVTPSLVVFDAREARARMFAQTEALGIHPIVAFTRQLAPLMPQEDFGELAFLFEQPAASPAADAAVSQDLPLNVDPAQPFTQAPAYA